MTVTFIALPAVTRKVWMARKKGAYGSGGSGARKASMQETGALKRLVMRASDIGAILPKLKSRVGDFHTVIRSSGDLIRFFKNVVVPLVVLTSFISLIKTIYSFKPADSEPVRFLIFSLVSSAFIMVVAFSLNWLLFKNGEDGQSA
ncbi:MAG: hypothetical protein CVT48_01330 [Thermoplasmata archaeon HGW-Thermoplasmata-1]|nr:MAG: hypothetical protein CVT48_01330 [Thermoplasmata archaeon HGW-Thermoplasmata-1]